MFSFSSQVDKILKVIPRERRTFLFSATMTKKVDGIPVFVLCYWLQVLPGKLRALHHIFSFGLQVQKLQRAALKDPVKCAVSTKYSTVDKLQQYYIFIPSKYKVGYTEIHVSFHILMSEYYNDCHGIYIKYLVVCNIYCILFCVCFVAGLLPGVHLERTCRQLIYNFLQHV